MLASGCANVPKMYQDFEAAPHQEYASANEAFAQVKPSLTYTKLGETQDVDFGDKDPTLSLDPKTGNRGYFKIVKRFYKVSLGRLKHSKQSGSLS